MQRIAKWRKTIARSPTTNARIANMDERFNELTAKWEAATAAAALNA